MTLIFTNKYPSETSIEIISTPLSHGGRVEKVLKLTKFFGDYLNSILVIIVAIPDLEPLLSHYFKELLITPWTSDDATICLVQSGSTPVHHSHYQSLTLAVSFQWEKRRLQVRLELEHNVVTICVIYSVYLPFTEWTISRCLYFIYMKIAKKQKATFPLDYLSTTIKARSDGAFFFVCDCD